MVTSLPKTISEAACFARSKNKKAIIRIVLNRTRTGTLLTDAVQQSLGHVAEAILPVTLADRQSYQHATLGGWDALDPKAEKEMFQLTVAVTSLR